MAIATWLVYFQAKCSLIRQGETVFLVLQLSAKMTCIDVVLVKMSFRRKNRVNVDDERASIWIRPNGILINC